MPRSKKQSKKRFKKNNLWLKLAIAIGLLTTIAVGIYSVNTFLNSEQENKGFFVCNDANTVCELSQHAHADLSIYVCEKEVIFPKEKGDLSKAHTHKEKNLMHWHDRLRIDPKTKIPLDPTPLKISSFLKQMEYEFPKTCGTNPSPTLSVSVNGTKNSEMLDYTWRDGDAIIIEYK